MYYIDGMIDMLLSLVLYIFATSYYCCSVLFVSLSSFFSSPNVILFLFPSPFLPFESLFNVELPQRVQGCGWSQSSLKSRSFCLNGRNTHGIEQTGEQ